MKVIGIDLYRVRLPLRSTFETSSHRKDAIEHILVRLHDESGLDGWGEIACGNGPWFSAEYVSTAWAVATEFLVPAVLGQEWRHPGELNARWSGIAGHLAAKAGFDCAAWDLSARRDGVPLTVALGTSPRAIPVGVSVGIEESNQRLVERVGGYLDEGYHRVKLKIRPGWDVEPVRAVRGAYPDLLLHVDANGAYRPGAESDEVMRQLDDLGLAMVEQPYPGRDFVSHARLGQRIGTPLCLDESIEDIADLETMLALDAAQVVNIKVSRVGGLTPALALARRCAGNDVGVWCGGMHEFGVGRAANIAFACDPAFDYPPDLSGSDKYFARDVVDPPIVAREGYVSPAPGPGLGLAVDLARIESIALDVERRRAPD
ncbi:o-succinylbenzoate synthase [Phytohabitans kaempferiae]|uniref:o-succinylbenzoate synthase n=1 Tax=Phytohabitans kaempferiae TaxID=1620943 RepID=A0ABV6M503_9ACTN